MLERERTRQEGSPAHLPARSSEGLRQGPEENLVIRRIPAAPLLYAATGPARWLRTAALLVEARGSRQCARQWRASRLAATGAAAGTAQQQR